MDGLHDAEDCARCIASALKSRERPACARLKIDFLPAQAVALAPVISAMKYQRQGNFGHNLPKSRGRYLILCRTALQEAIVQQVYLPRYMFTVLVSLVSWQINAIR